MTIGLVKLILERDFGAPVKTDVRVFHVRREELEEIKAWFTERGWIATCEEEV